MAYQKQTWVDYPDRSTPITAERLNHMEAGIEAGNVARHSNPNFLDNPFFTVNQRGGKITPYGIPLYTDASLSNVIAISNATLPVVELTATYAKVRDITVAVESYLYTKASDVVDGYVGSQYTVDRWYAISVDKIERLNDGIGITSSISGWSMRQLLNTDSLKSKTVTLSIDVGSIQGTWRMFCGHGPTNSSSSWAYSTVDFTTPGIHSLTLTLNANDTWLCYGIQHLDTNTHTMLVKSTKLELGSVSTLANDVAPNYAEELAKCQRYFQKLKYLTGAVVGNGYTLSSSIAKLGIELPAPMRKVPVCTASGVADMLLKVNGASIATTSYTSVTLENESSHLSLQVAASGLPVNHSVSCRANSNDVMLELSADL